jgi:hypothetical protein
MTRFVKAIVAAASLSVALGSPDADFAVPVIGYVYDAAPGQVRPLAGTPGAATVGSGVAVGAFEKALMPGDGSFAVVSSPGSDALQFLRFSGSGVETSSIENVPPTFEKASLSVGASSALLYAAGCDCVRVVSELRGAPKLLRTLSLPQGAEVRTLAVDDKATAAAIAIRIDGGSKVLLYGGDSETATAELGLWADALAFDEAGARLLVVETAARKLHLISNVAQSPTLDEILSERDGLSSPSAAAFASEGTVLLSDADAGVFVWNESGRTSRLIECLCKPSALERTASAGMYRLSALERGAVWLLDFSVETPRTFFIPAPRAEASK